jgi:hypothetical protein
VHPFAVIGIVDIKIAIFRATPLSLTIPRPPHAEFKLDVKVAEYDGANNDDNVAEGPTGRTQQA